MATFSMTGYASDELETQAGHLTIELKSVNSRFLDLQFKMNEELRAFEPFLRELIGKQVSRGKIECRLSLARGESKDNKLKLNKETLNSLKTLQDELRSQFTDARPMSVGELLRWPGVIEEADIDSDLLRAEVLSATDNLLKKFIESRRREGLALKDVLLDRVVSMEEILEKITPLLPEILANFKQKAVERLQEAFGIATDNSSLSNFVSKEEILERIRQEVTLFGMRIDVAEELARMKVHLNETRSILQNGGKVGKRLDFMMQELNREANTLGSKSTVKELSDASMELKLLIEQMREQVQNLE